FLIAELDWFRTGYEWTALEPHEAGFPHQLPSQDAEMMERHAGFVTWCPVSERADDLLRCAFAADALLLEIGKAFSKENRRDDACVKSIQQRRLVYIQAFERRLIEKQVWPVRHIAIIDDPARIRAVVSLTCGARASIPAARGSLP